MKTTQILLSICVIIFFTFLIAPTLLEASEKDVEWSVTLYDEGSNALVTLSPDNEVVRKLPNLGYSAEAIQVTNDHRYAVGLFHQVYGQYTTKEVVIIDLITGAIQYVDQPPLEGEEFFVGYTLGTFNPEMTAVAVAYVSHDPTSGFGCCGSGGIVIIDLVSGEILNTLDIDATFDTPGKSTAWLTHWTEEGIWFSPRCSTCTPHYKFDYHLWNPYDDTLIQTSQFDDLKYAERLPVTGELLYGENHVEFPLGGLHIILPSLNVVSVYGASESPPNDAGQVVYFDIENVNFKRPHWVMGGKAFIVRGSKNVLVLRDGRQIEFDANWREEKFLTMTNDGWLSMNINSNTIRHFSVNHDQITHENLYHAKGHISVANSQLAPLKDELHPFEKDIAPPDIEFCHATMPNRLQAGDIAEVIVLPEGYMYGGLIVGDVDFYELSFDKRLELPMGAQVKVLEEPVCSYESWVKVDYEGTIGWMVEVFQATYCLEPVTEL